MSCVNDKGEHLLVALARLVQWQHAMRLGEAGHKVSWLATRVRAWVLRA